MELVLLLIAVPLISAILAAVVRLHSIRNIIIRASFVLMSLISIYLLVTMLKSDTVYFTFNSDLISKTMFVIEAAIAVFIICLGIKYRKFPAIVFVTIQFSLLSWYEYKFPGHSDDLPSFFIDKFSIIMALIIGIIGGLICIYAIGYMKDYHARHTEIKDRQPVFFFIVYVFLAAMFGIVFLNKLPWLFFCWEITTLCSFLLIGYSRTREATDNAFLALTMNLAGGVAFALAIIWLASSGVEPCLSELIKSPKGTVMIPVALICFAGMTKSAQLPFSSWLLGAMVAPTPTSALLHSSTMVKAGVYIIIRLCPQLNHTLTGSMLSLIGAVTFLFGAFIAVSQSNAKKILAWSTVSNLGLIVACAGIGTWETVWAAIFLIIFHAVAKSLMFLCVGTVENRIGSRDLEDMDNIIVRLPKLAVMMIIGISGMFVAPFGMLISKWAAIRAFVDANRILSPILLIILAYGSAVTVLFWSKWIGKMTSAYTHRTARDPMEDEISADENFSQMVHAVLTVCVCIMFPLISTALVEPYIISIYGHSFDINRSNFVITGIMVALVILLPAISVPRHKSHFRYATPYMSGRNEYTGRIFDGSMETKKQLELRNYYLGRVFGGNKTEKIGTVLAACLTILLFGVSLI
jgi:ech hydrogenase subunit A